MIYGQVQWSRTSPVVWYVSQLPARKGTPRALRDGVDWGYTTKFEGKESWHTGELTILDKAIPLSPYWQKRFLKMLRDTNMIGQLVDL